MYKNYNVEICCIIYTDADLNLNPVPPPADLVSTPKQRYADFQQPPDSANTPDIRSAVMAQSIIEKPYAIEFNAAMNCFLVKGSGHVNAWCTSGRHQRAVLLSADANLLPHQRCAAQHRHGSKRLYFLKQLKRAGVPYKQLHHFCTAVIRPVLEYAALAWHHLINRTQAQHLESVQKWAIHIIFNFTRGMSYPNVLFVAQLKSLETSSNVV